MENSPKTQKQISTELEQKNLGVDKILLNINGGSSKLQTNNNAILKYTLEQPIKLEVGDVITCTNAWVEEKGLQDNTISIENDIETEMRFMYYKQGDCGDELLSEDDIGFCQYPKIFPDTFTKTRNARTELDKNYIFNDTTGTYDSLVGDNAPNMNNNAVGYGVDIGTELESEQSVTTGCNGNYYYLMETVEYDSAGDPSGTYTNQVLMRPCYGKTTIKVKAGNYSVDSLANIISSQLNGSLGKNNNDFSDALLDKLYNPKASANSEANFFKTTPYFSNIATNSENPDDSDIIGTNHERAGFERRVEGVVKQINMSEFSYYESWAWQNLNNDLDQISRLPHGVTFPNGLVDVIKTPNFDGTPPDIQTLLNTSSFYTDHRESHFYLNLGAMKHYFENDTGKYYCDPGLKTNSLTLNVDPYRPPRATDLFDCVMDIDEGYIFDINQLPVPVHGSKYDNTQARYAFTNSCVFNSMLMPVKGFKYQGDLGLPHRTKFAGTSVAQLTFGSSVSNKFALQNFHEFYKLPNVTPDGKSVTGYGGQQSTKFNNPYSNTIGQNVFDNQIGGNVNMAYPIYPVDSSSGIAVNNFDFGLVKTTDIYKAAVAEIQSITSDNIQSILYKEKLIYDLYTKPFEQFFDNQEDAKTAWEGSLWSRLGFDYNQLGNISENLETISTAAIPRSTTTQKGIITHNEFDFTQIVSSDGLGGGNPNLANGTPMQNYRLTGYYTGEALPLNYGAAGNIFHLLCNSKPINATNLPSLNAGKSYLLIESDIIKPNFKDNNAQWGNLLAVMSKENASNDTIFGAQPIDFIVTEPKLLSEISLFIKNPDGTLVNEDVIGKNSGFIIQISKPIKVTTLPTLTM